MTSISRQSRPQTTVERYVSVAAFDQALYTYTPTGGLVLVTISPNDAAPLVIINIVNRRLYPVIHSGITTVMEAVGFIGASSGTIFRGFIDPRNASYFTPYSASVEAFDDVVITHDQFSSPVSTNGPVSSATLVVGQNAGPGTAEIISQSNLALTVGGTGHTNPAFQVNSALTGTGILVTSHAGGNAVAIACISSGGSGNENITVDTKGAGTLVINGTTAATNAGVTIGQASGTGAVQIISQNSNALTVGRQGSTNPALAVNSNTSNSVTGVVITAGAINGGVAVGVSSTATNESLTMDTKGNGTLTLNAHAGGGAVVAGQDVQMTDGKNLVFGTSTGTMIGSTTSQRLGFYGKPPIALASTAALKPSASVFSASTTVNSSVAHISVSTSVAGTSWGSNNYDLTVYDPSAAITNLSAQVAALSAALQAVGLLQLS